MYDAANKIIVNITTAAVDCWQTSFPEPLDTSLPAVLLSVLTAGNVLLGPPLVLSPLALMPVPVPVLVMLILLLPSDAVASGS